LKNKFFLFLQVFKLHSFASLGRGKGCAACKCVQYATGFLKFCHYALTVMLTEACPLRPGKMGRLCYPTQHPGRVLVPRASGATKLSRCKEGTAHFLPSGYRGFVKAVSVAIQGYLRTEKLTRYIEFCF